MDLSIIIVSYRGWDRLRACLDSLGAFTGSMFKFEVIIVDNDSADDIIDVFELNYPDFIFIKNKVNGGFANGCNLGSTNAKGDFILFLNPDTVAAEESVGKLLERARANPGNFISSCRQVNEKKKVSIACGIFPTFGTLTGFGRTIFKLLNSKKFTEQTEAKNNIIYPDWVSGSVIMIKKEVFLNLEGFDEDYWLYYEDTDICKRIRDQKGNIAFYNDIEIQHNHGGSSRINIKTASITKTEVSISRHVYIAKHFTGAGRFIIQLYLVMNDLIAGTIMAFFGLVLFAFPRMFVYVHIYGKLIGYNFGVLMRRSWISPRSVNFNKNV
jgi:GT2 family glycosyltransferase